MHDLRYAIRTLRNRPALAIAAVLTLAIATGANTAIFTVFHRVLLRPLPYREPERLVFVWNAWKNGNHTQVAIPDYLDRRTGAPAIEDAALIAPGTATLSLSGPPEQVGAARVTASFFTTLGRGALVGRVFADGDAHTVVLTHALWQSRFGADPAAVGRTVRVNAEPHVILGVLPADFELPVREAELLLPFVFTPQQMSDQERGNEFSLMIARLRGGATIAELDAQMQTIVARLIDRVPARADYMRSAGFSGAATPMRDELVGEARSAMLLLQAGVAIVLLIACANVASLLLVRAAGRVREVAIRSSLGASTWRIGRQLAVEGGVLSALGAGAGLAIASAGTPLLARAVGDQVPLAAAASIDAPAIGFTMLTALWMAVVFAIVPALAMARRAPSEALKGAGSRSATGGKAGWIRNALAASEMAFAVMLVAAAGLLAVSLMRVLAVRPGFSTERVLSARIALPAARYADAAALRTAWSRVLEQAGSLPRVASAGLTAAVPFGGVDGSGTYRVVGRSQPATDTPPHGFQQTVGGEYFRTLEIPLIAGRFFTDADTAQAPRVVVVDELLARRQFHGESALGRQLNFGSPRDYTIVGVVGGVNRGDLSKPVEEERIYFSVQQVPQRTMGVVVKSRTDPAALTPLLRAAVQSVDPDQAVFEVRTLEERLSRALQPRRTPTILFVVFAAVALLLAAVGIYGVLSSSVAERAREFGIRQALGADRIAILRLVLEQGLATTFAGMAAGVLGSLILGRYLQSLLFGVTAHDPRILAASCAALLVVALAAIYVPARRAATLDPLIALRAE